jgi:hypothetical protein
MRTAATFNLTLLVTFAVLAALEFIGIKADLFFNGQWLEQGLDQWRWWNYLTSEHSLTVMYLQGYWWLLPSVLIALIVATRVALKN